MDFDFLPEIAAVNVESSLIPETDTETDTETAESSQNFETSGSNSEQQLWGKQINELSSIIANYDPTKPAPPFLMFAAEIASWHEGVKNKDIRPQVQDQISKEWLLVDSGAQVSVWPRNRVPFGDERFRDENKDKIPMISMRQGNSFIQGGFQNDR